jgi:hypothetical protein
VEYLVETDNKRHLIASDSSEPVAIFVALLKASVGKFQLGERVEIYAGGELIASGQTQKLLDFVGAVEIARP